MLEFVEKVILAGVGALTLTQDKGEELLSELKERFQLSEDEGRKLIQKLEESAKQQQARLEMLAQEEIQKAAEKIGLVPSEKLEALEARIAALEEQLSTQKQ
ncbi:MAG: phasin superfamily protein [Desulfuromonas sp.]|nr:MAG: phasin superfamily protein [Desulfuromonas sp.]